MNLKISDKYQPLWKDKSRYFIVTGGRGSGKSFGVAMFLLHLSYESGHKILFTRYTMVSASTSIIPEFVEKIELMNAHNDFRITKDEIYNLKTGSSIIFKGIRTSSGNQTASLKSLNGITTWVLDEAEELDDEETFDKIDLSVRVMTKQNRVIMVLNPATKEHWIYKRFFKEALVEAGSNVTKKDVTYIHTTYKDNKENLPSSFLQTIYKTKKNNPSKYIHQILGGWKEKAEGVIISNWKFGIFEEKEIMCYGQDFGFSTDETTLVKVSVDVAERKVWVKECYGKVSLATNEIAKLNKAYAGMSLIICDNSEPRLIRELKNFGINIKPTIKKSGSILSGIALMQDYQIIVDRSSEGIIKELNNYAWKDKGDKTVPIDKFNHYIDAIRYAMQFLVQGKSSGVYHIR